jgi:hypothetical protein
MFSPLDRHPAKQMARSGFPSHDGAPARGIRVLLSFTLLLLSAICNSCGSIASGPAPAISVSVVPGSAQLFAGASVPFKAVVQNAPSAAVSWQVNTFPGGNAAVGVIDSLGSYTAPISVATPLTVTITAVLQMDPTKTGSSNVTIQPDGSLSISPAIASFTPSQALQFKVSTLGFTNSDVTWAVDGIPSANTNATTGTISATGFYTAPSSPGLHVITTKLIANPASTGRAQAFITDFPGTLTWRNDNARSGVNSKEMALAAENVNSTDFGKLFSCPLDGYAYAQPLFVPNLAMGDGSTRNVIFVATEKDSVYAFDADKSPCAQLWHASLIVAGLEAVPTPNLDLTSTDIVPFIGITGTPAISLELSNLYVVAKTRSTAIPTTYVQRVYALDLATGQPKILAAGNAVALTLAPPNGLSPQLENQRPALLLDNGNLYIAFGSHGGQGDYHGWLTAYNAATLEQSGTFSVTLGGVQGGIWQSGGGPSADSNHNVYVLTGNGSFDANRGGINYGNSALRLVTTGAFFVADYFSPCNNATLGSLDFGASAPLLLDPSGAASQPHLVVGASKNGSLYVMNRENLGQFSTTCPDSPPRVQTVPVGDGPILSTPLFWNNAIYVAAGNGKLKSFPMQGGVLASSPFSSQSPEAFGAQGATPVVSSSGAGSGTTGAIIWLIDSSGALATPNTRAVLRAFDANNLSNEIYNSAMVAPRDTAGLAVKFTVPTVANGKVYVGTQSELDVYGLLH